MHTTHKFFKQFPAPKFLDIPYAGLAISDDAVHCIEYAGSGHNLTIRRYGMKALAPGVVESGEIKDDKALITALAELSKELKVYVVKASLPEEKMYLFKTVVPSVDIKEMRQNIEFKLEENVPLTVDEALFFFDLIPKETGVVVTEHDGSGNPVGVSVAPRSIVQSYLDAIKAAGITVLTFEVDAKGLARALVPGGSTSTDLIVRIMNKKTGLYIVCGGVVCFSSTIAWGSMLVDASASPKIKFDELKKSIHQVRNYWREHGLGTEIERVVFAGKDSLADGLITECSTGFGGSGEKKITFEMGKVWQNAFSPDQYVPPIPFEDSLDYGVAAGLALRFSQ
jgi:Tfp pilus assembly PilM family ATPase